MTSLEGHVIAITGAASGIGLATAKLLSSRGAILSLSDINKSSLEAVSESLPKGTTSVALDVRDGKEVTAWIEKTIQDHGRLDGAVNFAGVGRLAGPLKDETDEGYDLVMGVNVFGIFNCLRAELKHMKDGGCIINAASVAGLQGQPGASLYCASKHAVIGLTKTAARENPGIRVNAVAPGVVKTAMVEEAEKHIGFPLPTTQQIQDRQADPKELAGFIAFLLSSEASFMTGTVYNVDGGFMC